MLVSQAFGVVDLYDQLADFGADQVILVRDEEVQKQVHSRIGSEVLILTVLQSKGMEFEDVVLLNFFSASSYLASYRALDRLIDKKYGEFDRKKHSVSRLPFLVWFVNSLALTMGIRRFCVLN